MTHRIERIEDCELHLADCRDVLPTLGRVDAVITDPPYGVGFGYEAHDDRVLVDWLDDARNIASLVAFTPGIRNVWSFPKADWIYCWAKPGSTRRSDGGGFNCWEPILVYGKKRVWSDLFYLPTAPNISREAIDHPCPKPLALMRELCAALTVEGQSICDPFMGSGTTGVACVKLGRKFVGCEIDPKYFDIACRRIEEAYSQPDMFVRAQKPSAEQLAFLEVSA